jgi:3-hydroxymyristoyl/3-hydroxydecanoyl-(acyl carrier protein) dehydratase
MTPGSAMTNSAMTNAVRAQIRSLLRVEPREGGVRAQLFVDPKLIVLKDHFHDYPLLPGICMIQAVILACAARQGLDNLHVHTLKTAKMMHPVRPGEQLVIDAEMASGPNGSFVIKAKLSSGDKRCAEFSLVAGPHAVNGGIRP